MFNVCMYVWLLKDEEVVVAVENLDVEKWKTAYFESIYDMARVQ